MPVSLPVNVLRHGRDEPSDERIALRAGPMSMVFEPKNVFLRYVRLGDREVIRGIYAAVRDEHWGTVPPVISNLQKRIEEESFELTFDVDCRQGAIDFAWRGRIAGTADGTVTFEFDGAARSTFLRNRIGVCLLHPLSCCGVPCTVEHADGGTEEGCFPPKDRISPHQPFKDIRAIRQWVCRDGDVEVRFEGDVFEMEDQRNWTDASFKTYCPPLALSIPVEVAAGAPIRQTATIRVLVQEESWLRTMRGALARVAQRRREAVTLHAGFRCTCPLPEVGVAAPPGLRELDGEALRRLAALGLDHLRVDLHLASGDWQAELRSADELAEAMDTGLELAVFAPDPSAPLLQALSAAAPELHCRVRRVLLLSEGRPFTAPELLVAARELLTPAFRQRAPDAPAPDWVVGTAGYFAELNRNYRLLQGADGVCWSANPQVHAFDDATLMETLEGQTATVGTALGLEGQPRRIIGPITLKSRRPSPPSAEGLPADVDVRQTSLLCAAWTVGSLGALSAVDAATFFEAAGPTGIMAPPNMPLPSGFPPVAGMVYPVYHVLADVGEFLRGGREATGPRRGSVGAVGQTGRVAFFGMSRDDGMRVRVLIANLTPEPQDVVLQPWRGPALVRILDDTTAIEAMAHPEEFRKLAGEPRTPATGRLGLRLRPYAVARIDSRQEEDL